MLKFKICIIKARLGGDLAGLMYREKGILPLFFNGKLD